MLNSTVFKVLAAVTLALALLAGAYWAGWTRADAVRQAEVASLEANHAQAYADAERQARERLEAETARANTLAAQLGDTKARLVAQTKDITRRIKDAAKAAAGCAFGPDFVRLFNEALGYPGGGALPQSAGPTGTAAGGSAAPAAGPGVLPDQPVTPEDLLAFARDYGAWARGVQAQNAALHELLREGR